MVNDQCLCVFVVYVLCVLAISIDVQPHDVISPPHQPRPFFLASDAPAIRAESIADASLGCRLGAAASD